MNLKATINLRSAAAPLAKGDQVTVDGLPGFGFVYKREGQRVTIRFRSGLYVSRDIRYVHPIDQRLGDMGNYRSAYMSPMERR